MSRWMQVRYGAKGSAVEAGDIIQVRGSPSWRLVTSPPYKGSISFVRMRSSWCWDRHHQNSTAFHALPMTLRVLRRATPETRELAYRFRDWLRLGRPPQEQWERVCALGAEAILCSC